MVCLFVDLQMSLMSSVVELLAMGCVCARETVEVNGRRFHVRSRLGEG